MSRIERVRNLQSRLQGQLQIEGLSGDPLAQRLPFEHLHRDIGAALEFSDLVYGADVGMIERGSGARLALEALESLRVVCEHIRQEFQGHTPAKTQVFGFVDFAHSAGTETPQNSIV